MSLPADLSSDLAVAWTRLGSDAVAALLARHVGPGWKSRGSYARGPCPRGIGKCLGQAEAAYCRRREDGWPPWVYCNHKKSCGFAASAFELLADSLGSKRSAAGAVLDAACVVVARRSRRSRRGRDPEITEGLGSAPSSAGGNAAAESWEAVT